MPGQMRTQMNHAMASSPSADTDATPSAPANQSSAAAQQSPAKPHRGHKAANAAANAASAPAAPSAAPAAPSSGAETAGRRDPFTPLLQAPNSGSNHPENLPPGKAGLMVDTLRIDGIVQGPNGMIAIVENPQARVYFLRDGDKLYDGAVTHIVLDAVTFHQTGTDAFGKPVDRELTKRLNPSSSGDSQ